MVESILDRVKLNASQLLVERIVSIIGLSVVGYGRGFWGRRREIDLPSSFPRSRGFSLGFSRQRPVKNEEWLQTRKRSVNRREEI